MTDAAAADLREIKRWLLRRAGRERTATTIERIRQTARTYGEHPRAGRCEDGAGNTMRSFVEAPYVVFYVEEPGGIAVVRIIHGSRDRDSALRERPLDLNN